MMTKFDPVEEVKAGWEIFKPGIGMLYGSYALMVGVQIAMQVVVSIMQWLLSQSGSATDVALVSVILSLASSVISVWLGLGLIRIVLDLVDGHKSELTRLFSQSGVLVQAIIAGILSGLIIAIGFMLLVIPGIIFAMKLQFVSSLIIDKKLGPIAAIKESWRITDGSLGNLFIFLVLLLVLNFVAMLLLLIPLLITLPVSYVAWVCVYRKLSPIGGLEGKTP